MCVIGGWAIFNLNQNAMFEQSNTSYIRGRGTTDGGHLSWESAERPAKRVLLNRAWVS